MKQFLLPDDLDAGEPCADRTITVTGGDFHYLVNVRRLSTGDSFPGVSRAGDRYSCTITSLERDRAIVECRLSGPADTGGSSSAGGKSTAGGTDNVELVLCQCVPKLPKMDLIIRMASEIGVSRIIPVLSRHSAAGKSDIDVIEGRRQRWEKIAREALQQSGRKRLLPIESPRPLDDLPDICGTHDENSAGVFGDETGVHGVSLHQLLGLHRINRVFMLVGPEGGLSAQEREVLVSKGFAPVYLGETVLRTETAAIALASVVRFLLLENDEWKPKKG